MRTDRILKLRDHLMNLEDPKAFSMRRWIHECGAPSCMAGYGKFLALKDPEFNAAKYRDHSYLMCTAAWLEINPGTAEDLFKPSSNSYPTLNFTQFLSGTFNEWNINNEEAAAILDYFAETGVVDFWTPIYGPIEQWPPQEIKF